MRKILIKKEPIKGANFEAFRWKIWADPASKMIYVVINEAGFA